MTGWSPRVATAAGGEDWMTSVNHFRAQAGVSPVASDASLAAAATAHSCYMLQNGISHGETPGKPGYTAAGDAVGQQSNVAVSSSISATDRSFVELWMTAPYHAIGILRHGVSTMAYGSCRDGSTPLWHAAATLDVVSGIADPSPTPVPVTWPGDGTHTNLSRFVSESPSPVAECGWTGDAGLPIVAMLPEPADGATVALTGPGGPLTACVLTAATSTDPTARAILLADNAVVILPRTELAPGVHQVQLSTPSRTVSWSFTIDPAAADWTAVSPPTAPLQAPTDLQLSGSAAGFAPLAPQRLVDTRTGLGATRLAAGVPVSVAIAGTGAVPADASAVSVNLTVVSPAADGYLSAYRCDGQPSVSTVNFAAGTDTPNAAVVPLGADGTVCLYASAATDVLLDVNGAMSAEAGGGFVAVPPTRLVDTRVALRSPGRLAGGTLLPVTIAGGDSPVPAGATAVVLNVTAVDPGADGFVSAYPCDGGQPDVSSLNPHAGVTRPNLVVVPLDADGQACFFTTGELDLLADVTGYLAPTGGHFGPVDPTRIADTRTGARVPAGGTLEVQIAGVGGLPAAITAAAVNVTAVGPDADGYVTAYACGGPVPATSTLNVQAGHDAANGAQIALGGSGELCLTSTVGTDLIVDLGGVWL